MDLRQLSALVALADHGSFTAAADALRTVQSNVSTHVAHLERELGATLFDRAAGHLTPEGELVADRARRIASEVDAITSDVVAVRADVAGDVRLGLIATTGRWLAPLLLSAVAERHPGVHVIVVEASTTSLAPQVGSGRLDLAVVNLPLTDPDLVTEALFEEDLVVAAPPGHPLARRRTVTIAQAAKYPLLLPPPGTALRDELDVAAAAAGTRLQAQAELDGPHLLASLVARGVGAAILPATASAEAHAVVLHGLPRRVVGLASRRRGVPSAPARAVAAVLADLVREHAADQYSVRAPQPEASARQSAR
ncbi:MAG: putative LysR family transcriptional regulator [Acidimicrobiales bacterium]|jgi:DNA-binding transcriptional LysR family regulator|nr:putative LysR family transcriptional regulator [Acidimicrobiales bacterium]